MRARALVFKRFGDPFAAHDRNQRIVVSWESIIDLCGVFSLRIAFTRFNPDYIFLSLIYFFIVLIVWYSALLIYVVSIKIIFLLLFCYLIKDCASSSYLFFSFLFYFSNSLTEKNFILSSCIVFSMVASCFNKMCIMDTLSFYAPLKMFFYIISFL